MAKVSNIVLYRPKDGREDELLDLVKKHWPALRAAGLATTDRARLFRTSDKRTGKVTVIERFAWVDEQASSKAHHHPKIQAVWAPMDEVLDDMTILVAEEIAGRASAKAKRKTAPKRAASRKPARAKKTTKRRR